MTATEARAQGDDAAGDDAEGDDAAGDDAAGDDAAGDDAAGAEEGTRKRRRRRRKRRKGGEGEGDEAAEGVAADADVGERAEKTERGEKADKRPPPLPFHRFFDSSLRRHLFAVGEAIAGVVTRVDDDVAVIDVFGKATAFARRHEPREIPVVEIPLDDSSAGTVESPSVEGDSPEAAGLAGEVASDTVAHEASGTDASSVEAPSALDGADVPAEAAPEDADASEGEASGHADDGGTDEAPAAPDEPMPVIHYVARPEGVEPIAEGSVFRGRIAAVAESGHLAIVNEVVDRKATRRWLARVRDERDRVHGLVFGFNRGGFDVLVAGVRAFCPVNGMSLDSVEDPAIALGHWYEFHVQTVRSGSQGLVVSRRSILEREARKNARVFLKSLTPGTRVVGKVTSVRDFGIFVDIGHGAEGLVHQSEISFDRAARPADVAKPGDEIEVQVLEVKGADRKKKERFDRVSLSIKALLPDPFDQHGDALAEGIPRKGVVVRTAEFGAFVQLAPGIDGLLHITELGKDLKHASEAVSEGDELHVVIERIDKKTRRISLSRLTAGEIEAYEKGELEPASRAPRLKQGADLKVVVTQVGAAGLHVRIDNVIGKRGRGFIPNSEMGTPRGTDHRRKWPPGTEIDVKVIGTDRDGGLRCSRKRFLQDEERRAVKEYRKEASKQGLGTFGDILRSKLGIDQS
ncbi:MAG: S1 RNA-binding domain-containing protein [Sandaracinaceae bacterium]|nr:S1 RNA-binding domain-containing protein [Sandaracinaceae bacterium]